MIRVYKLDHGRKFYLEGWGEEGTSYSYDPKAAFEFGNVEGADDVAWEIGKSWGIRLFVEET